MFFDIFFIYKFFSNNMKKYIVYVMLLFLSGCTGGSNIESGGFQSGSNIFLSELPKLLSLENDPYITLPHRTYIVYGKPISTKPLLFEKDSFIGLSLIPNGECVPQEQIDSIMIKNDNSYLDDSIIDKLNTSGAYWINMNTCSAVKYQKIIDDHYIVHPTKDVFYQDADMIFKGVITELKQDIGLYDDKNWDRRHKYTVKINTFYLNLLGDMSDIDTEIIGWIPPKTGEIYFFTKYDQKNNKYQSYITKNPRLDWFNTKKGVYKVAVTSKEYSDNKYHIKTKILQTLQGKILDTLEFETKEDFNTKEFLIKYRDQNNYEIL